LNASTHWGTQALCDHFIRTNVCIGVFEIAKAITRDCMICQQVNKKIMRRPPQGGRELARRPFQNIQTDFTELPQVQRFKYLFVIVDHLTHWVEAYPTIKATAEVVSKILLEQIIPRYGIINTVDLDRGPHFTAKILHQMAETLNVAWKLQTPRRSQSSGRVERMNQMVKIALTKLMEETKMNWLKCFPLALMRIRTKLRPDIGVSPYKIILGLPFLTTSGNIETYEEGEQGVKKYLKVITSTLEELRQKG
ncbi:TF29 protein, partial [Cinclus mexicanus]|nr:TF29 protein [Cinclus mexicanus]